MKTRFLVAACFAVLGGCRTIDGPGGAKPSSQPIEEMGVVHDYGPLAARSPQWEACRLMGLARIGDCAGPDFVLAYQGSEASDFAGGIVLAIDFCAIPHLLIYGYRGDNVRLANNKLVLTTPAVCKSISLNNAAVIHLIWGHHIDEVFLLDEDSLTFDPGN